MQTARVAGQPGQLRNDDRIGVARADRSQQCQQAGAARVVGRFAKVLKDSDEFDLIGLRDRPNRGYLSVEPGPWICF